VTPLVQTLTCPVCSAPLDPNAVRCGYCGSYVVIAVDHQAIDPGSIDRANVDLHIARFREALRRDPNDARAHYGLGLAYFNLGLAHEAAGELERAAALTPENASLQVQLGTVYADLADLGERGAADKAVERARRALVLDPAHPGANLLRARLALRSGDAHAFLARLRDAHAAEPDAIRAAAASYLAANTDILATAPQFREAAGSRPDTSPSARMRKRALVVFGLSMIVCLMAARIAPQTGDPSPNPAREAFGLGFGLLAVGLLLATLVYAVRWLRANHASARPESIQAATWNAMLPFVEGTVADPGRLLGAIAYVIQERDRQAREAALAAARANTRSR
jgi:tetratricopeptide (TPR) repeat protein